MWSMCSPKNVASQTICLRRPKRLHVEVFALIPQKSCMSAHYAWDGKAITSGNWLFHSTLCTQVLCCKDLVAKGCGGLDGPHKADRWTTQDSCCHFSLMTGLAKQQCGWLLGIQGHSKGKWILIVTLCCSAANFPESYFSLISFDANNS